MASNLTYGLVLAGGESRRMGHDKAQLRRDGQSQLAWMVALLERHTGRVFVSLRPEQRDDPERAQFAQIVDADGVRGPVAGIVSAVAAFPAVDWLVVACDLPNIDSETLGYLMANRSEEHWFTAYRSSYDGLPEPLCAVYRVGCGGVLREFVDEGVYCPRKILIRSNTNLLEQPNPHALDNINTPEDLRGSVLQAGT